MSSTQAAADLEAVHARQHQVQHDQVEPPGQGQLEPLQSVVGNRDGESEIGQVQLDQVCDIPIVFDHQELLLLHA